MADPVHDSSWLEDQLSSIGAAIKAESDSMSTNNGKAVDANKLVQSIKDPVEKARAQASLNEWVKRQGILFQGWRKFLSIWDQANAQARKFLGLPDVSSGTS